jgi:hypothetical protein
MCVNSKAYPTNTCILEREHHLRPAYPSYENRRIGTDGAFSDVPVITTVVSDEWRVTRQGAGLPAPRQQTRN